jgi:hypothetical protein
MYTTTMTPEDSTSVAAHPEFCDGKQLYSLFGLTRTHAYQLVAEGKIRSVCIRRKGATRGRRLYDCGSVREFLRRLNQGEAHFAGKETQ